MSQEQAHEWAAEYLRGTASSETVAHFSRALAGDADLRRWFLEYVNVDGALAANLAAQASPLAEFDRELRPGRFARLSRLAAVIVCALSPLVLLSWLVWHQHAALPQPDRARAAVAALHSDHDLISLVDFADARLLTAALAPGRWKGSLAADFQAPEHHVSLTVDAERTWSQVTLATWVRLDRSALAFRALVHVDGWEAEKTGQVHWMLTDAGTVRLSILGNHVETLSPAGKRPLRDYADADSLPIPSTEDGRWVHLATVYDANERTIRFYVDGRPHGHAVVPTAHPAGLGPSRLGNWDADNRVLGGRMDEFLILGRALSERQIQDLYQAGNPYR
jgi:hypothetical protein